ncbi:MAG: penicillin-binding transpeptidase domain-containing protein [Phycisphaerae bacterium]
MFERRLRIVLMIPIFCGLILVWRLFQLQVVRGERYQRLADEALLAPRRFLPPLRGRILDRHGRVLVSDEPVHDVTVYYGALCMRDAYVQKLAINLRRRDHHWRAASSAALEAEVRRRIHTMWTTLARISGIPLRELRRRRDAICDSVERLRRHIWQARRRKGFDEPFRHLHLVDEGWYYPILRNCSPEVRTRLELSLASLPFVRIEPSVRRVWCDDAEPLCHLIGRLGEVSAERIETDPLKEDPLGRYRAGDQAGVSGVEWLGERMLRGRRGFEERTLDGEIKATQPPVDGRDVRLTIDFDLQRRVAALLESALAEEEQRTGAACVVLDVQTREILALVSVPTYSLTEFQQDYESLRDDAKHRPLLFRAVGEEYQPGSIMKPVAMLAGFHYGLVDPQAQVFCDGSFIPGSSKWHCWTYWRGLAGHGYISAEEAIMHSCNVYFYGLGQRLQAGRLTDFYRDFIYGPVVDARQWKGTGLREERRGLIPSPRMMRERWHRGFRPADGRNYAIGQGEIQITPLQAANIFATLATGVYRDPTIIANDGAARPEWVIPHVPDEAWRLARRGVDRVVNEVGGTAYHYARMDDLEICGKTGSAQCVSRAVLSKYTFDLGDDRTGTVAAPTVERAREMLDLPQSARCLKRKVLERWPPDRPEKKGPPTHAWFAGFAPYRRPRIALAVIIEHGGSGGRAAGPIGRAIFETLLAGPHDYLGAGDEPSTTRRPESTPVSSTQSFVAREAVTFPSGPQP